MAPLYRRLLSGLTPLALIASVGLVAGCGVDEPNENVPDSTQTDPAGSSTVAAMPVSLSAEPTQLEVAIPTMGCPYACFPTVKETLEKQPGVLAVDLADPEDAEDGVIEDRRVFVTAVEGFDVAQATRALTKVGQEPTSIRNAPAAAGAGGDADTEKPAESDPVVTEAEAS